MEILQNDMVIPKIILIPIIVIIGFWTIIIILGLFSLGIEIIWGLIIIIWHILTYPFMLIIGIFTLPFKEGINENTTK